MHFLFVFVSEYPVCIFFSLLTVLRLCICRIITEGEVLGGREIEIEGVIVTDTGPIPSSLPFCFLLPPSPSRFYGCNYDPIGEFVNICSCRETSIDISSLLAVFIRR